jgi:hypothetical protein
MRTLSTLATFVLIASTSACGGDDGDDSATTIATGATTTTATTGDGGTGDTGETGDGDGTTSGDGDGTSFTTGDGTTGDGDGTATGDGDGDYMGPYSGGQGMMCVCFDAAETGCIVLQDPTTMVETGLVCYAPCTPPDASSCPTSLPPGGTATPACAAIVGTGECILDCSAGQMCPTGMSCINATLCAWDF